MKFSFNRINLKNIFFVFLVLLITGWSVKSQSGQLFRPGIKIFRIGTDTLIYHSEVNRQKYYNPVFSFRSRVLYFEIDTSSQPRDAVYEYFLEGLNRGFQSPTYYPVKEYTNLAYGEYIFHVRENIDHQIIDVLDYPFRILPPFYRTYLAYVFYLLFIVLLSWSVARSRNYQFAKQRYQLERLINERTHELLKEKDRTEDLLANVLPKGTADEIKTTGRATKKKFQMVTVLFSDIQGFTKIAESMNPEILIDELDKFFFHFDSVAEKYNIEKIKTIGDAYMCAGGIPEKNRTNPVEVVLAALEMQQYMIRLKQELSNKHNQVWDIRIGIHTGPVVAGVVGHKKLSYDIWGDTVNTASRMESSGEAGKINISGSTYQLVKDYFNCEYRGKMPVKYKGEIDMYFVNGIRPELSGDSMVVPGKKFITRLQLLRLQDLEEYVVTRMEEEIPHNLAFHNIKHTIQVYTIVELLGRAEGVSDEAMLLLRTAALLYDLGYLTKPDNHLEASCDYAFDLLPKYQYGEEQIKEVCKLISSTKHPYNPETLLQKIICDANYNYLGRVDFADAAALLWQEEKSRNQALTFTEWKKKMRILINKYEYHTETARKLRNVDKSEQLSLIRDMKENH
ncbi:MAG: HD domain-containing protein [Chlorobi bacterium]|nr:HD domain-containing protein [Chlorobiota bacterium]